jgi:DNA-binding MarR family transcriptional regulator
MSSSRRKDTLLETQADELLRHWLELGRRMLSRKLSSSLYPEFAGKLSRGQLHALMLLAEADEPCISELAAALSLDESTVTRLVDKLEAEGLAERRRSTTDRRSTTVVMTKAGQDVIDCAREHQRALMAEVLGALDRTERAEYVRLTAKAAEALRARTDEVVSR